MGALAHRLIWSQPAIEDVEEIAEPVGQYSRARSGHVVGAIASAARRLCTHPRLGRFIPGWELYALRQLIVLHRFRLIYRLDTPSVVIVSVMHTSRELPEKPPWDLGPL